jgi:glycosyltransferase involved in cell wall biosynthesis
MSTAAISFASHGAAAPACAVVLPIRLYGGHERMLLEWLRIAKAQHGLRVQIYSAADNERLVRACEAAGFGRPIISHPSPGSSIADFFATWRLLGRIPREVPILFAPGVVQASPLQWLAAFLRRRRVAGYVPMAYSSRHMRFRGGAVRDWVVAQVVRRVDLWITISQQQRDLLMRQWRVKPPVFVVQNRLDLPSRDFPRSRAGTEGLLRILFAGRFDANQKGLDWLCERLRARRDEWIGAWRFIFKGQGAFQPELERLCRELGPRNIEVRPWGDVGEAMAEADMLLLPSRFEGLPLVALEATHYGIPIVASEKAGVSDFVQSSSLFNFGDEEALWAALTAMRDPVARAEALAYSRARVRQSLSTTSFRQEVDGIVAALKRLHTALRTAD